MIIVDQFVWSFIRLAICVFLSKESSMRQASPEQQLPPFDELVELAEKNPAAFEQFKRDMCEEMILSASTAMRDRLWAQQSHIDLVVKKCKNPNQANVLLMTELTQQMSKFQSALEGEISPSHPDSRQDNIIPFPQSQWR